MNLNDKKDRVDHEGKKMTTDFHNDFVDRFNDTEDDNNDLLLLMFCEEKEAMLG